MSDNTKEQNEATTPEITDETLYRSIGDYMDVDDDATDGDSGADEEEESEDTQAGEEEEDDNIPLFLTEAGEQADIDNDDDESDDGIAVPTTEDLAKLFEDPELLKDPKYARRLQEQQKGIEKLANRLKAQEQIVRERVEAVERDVRDFENVLTGLNDPDRWHQTLDDLRMRLEEHHGTPYERTESRYGFDHASDDKVYTQAERLVMEQKKRLDALEAEAQERKLIEKRERVAQTQSTELKRVFGDWVTPEQVAAAIKEFPDLPVKTAFQAKYAIQIAKKAVEYSTKRAETKPKRDMLTGGQSFGGKRSDGDWRDMKVSSILDYMES